MRIESAVNMLSVSVVVPTYNAADYLPAALDSLLNQSLRNAEIVVVDDGSTDSTSVVLAPYRDRIVYHHQSNSGLAEARNIGMDLASGDLIAWADADDICERDRLLLQAAYLASRPAVLAVGANFSAFNDLVGEFDRSYASKYYSQVARFGLDGLFPEREVFDGTGADSEIVPVSETVTVYYGDVWRRLVLGNFMHPPTLMFRRHAAKRAGRLRNGIRTAEDWDYITRIARLGPVAFIDAPLIRYRCHSGQMSASSGSQVALSCIRGLESNLGEHEKDLVNVKTDILRTLGEFHANAAYALSDSNPRQALLHLTRAIRLNWSGTRVGWLLARIFAPAVLLRLVRMVRERSMGSRGGS